MLGAALVTALPLSAWMAVQWLTTFEEELAGLVEPNCSVAM